jgi:WhiB family redox-sensing transcriptional regulator
MQDSTTPTPGTAGVIDNGPGAHVASTRTRPRSALGRSHRSAVTPISWRALARCRGVDPEIFHPAPEDDGAEAKAICALCPVREACLEDALMRREKDGVWGGLTARERRRVIRQRRKSA